MWCLYRRYDASNNEFYCCVGGEKCSPENCFRETDEHKKNMRELVELENYQMS